MVSSCTGHAPVSADFTAFLLPTLLGNTIGGDAMVAILNNAPLVEELNGPQG